MPSLLFRFAVVLEDYGIEPYSLFDGERHHGPLFHKWLPNGEADAVPLVTGDSNADLKVWFEQSGYMENGRIKFDYERKEIDSATIPEHGILDAGPLIGLMRLDDLSDEAVSAVQENQQGDPRYVALGRRVIRLVYPPISRFLNILRSNYGQYWISELRAWDPHEQSLGHYLSVVIQTKWSLDGESWLDFVPDPKETPATPIETEPDYREYLNQEDWSELIRTARLDYHPPLGALMLIRAHRLVEEHCFREAIVEGVTALEIALSEYYHRKARPSKLLGERLEPLWSLPLSAQLAAVAPHLQGCSTAEVESTLRIIDMRHRVVHENWEPPSNLQSELRHLLKTAAALQPGPRFRFPSYYLKGRSEASSGGEESARS
jgi:hypothetical protein